jgi:hypothetical protein
MPSLSNLALGTAASQPLALARRSVRARWPRRGGPSVGVGVRVGMLAAPKGSQPWEVAAAPRLVARRKPSNYS